MGNWAQIGKDPIELSTVKGKDPTTWRPWTGESWNILGMWSTWGGTTSKSEPMDETGSYLFNYPTTTYDVCVWYYYIWCCLCVEFETMILLFIIVVLLLWTKSWSMYLLNKKASVCICLVCKQYLCYVLNVVWNFSMILSSKSILKRVERSKTNKISGRRDVTSKFSWIKQGKNHIHTRPIHGRGRANWNNPNSGREKKLAK